MKNQIIFLKPRIVKIICTDIDSKGTGFLISKDGYIATNFHVIGKVSLEGKVLYSNDISIENDILKTKAEIVSDKSKLDPVLHDYTILKIDKNDLDYFDFGDISSVEEGEDVFFGGFPLTQNKLTSHKGYISCIREASTQYGTSLQKVIDIDATVVGGNSGGPLVTEQNGKYCVIGIISQQVAIISQEFKQLEDFLTVQMTNPNAGGVFIAGVNPNAALLQTIKVLKANISTGIGTAISIQYLKTEFDNLIKKV